MYLALDYFDASVNRIAAWVTGFRNVQKALLNALLTPDMTAEQNAGNFTDLLVRQEELKTCLLYTSAPQGAGGLKSSGT